MHSRNIKLTVFILFVFAAFLPKVFAQLGNQQSVRDASRSAEIDYVYYNKQIVAYNDAIQESPNDAELYYGRGATYAYIRKFDEALKDYDKATAIKKNYDKPYYGRGVIYQVRQQYADAINEYDKAIELNTTIDDVRKNREDCLAEINKLIVFIRKIDELIALKPFNPELYSARGKSYAKIGKEKEANADFAREKQLTDTLKRNALIECSSIDYDCQIEIYSEQIKISLDMGNASLQKLYYGGRGIAYYEKDELDNALSDLNNAVGSYGSTKVRYYLGKIYQRQGKLDKALDSFGSSAGQFSPESYLGIGEVLFAKKDYETALEYFDKALFLNPRLSQAYLGRGTVYLERGRIYEDFDNNREKAVESYRKAVKDFDSVTEVDLKDVNPEVYLRRAKAYERLGEREKAEADRAKYLELGEKP